MMQKLASLCAWIIPILFMSFSPGAMYGAPQMADEKAEKTSAGSKQSVTGCLKKGEETGGFTITAEDGRVWELHSKKVQLAEHVGHTVAVTGTAANRSKAEEKKIEADEKKEFREKEHGDLRVSSLKMVGDSCK